MILVCSDSICTYTHPIIIDIVEKKGQVIFKNNLTYKAPLVGSRSNRFWMDLKKFRE